MRLSLHRRLLICVLFLLSTLFLRAQESQTFLLHFRFDSAQIDSTFKNNSKDIQGILNLVTRPDAKIDSIEIKGWSSPDGGLPRNITLSRERAESIKNFILANAVDSSSLNSSRIKILPMKENWDGLLHMVEKRYKRLDREKVIKILKAKGIGEETRKWRLQQLDNGYTWDFLRRIYMPDLRQATVVTLHYNVDIQVVADTQLQTEGSAGQLATSGQPTTADSLSQGTEPQSGKTTTSSTSSTSSDTSADGSTTADTPSPASKKTANFTMAVKTNMLYDLAMTPNIGIEFHLGKGWSIGANWAYAWWKNDNKAFYWRVYGGEIDVRKYFGKQAKERPLSGHHIGIYGQGLTYDFDLGKTGIISEFSYGAGVEYGYSLPVTKSLNIDFGVGFGYLGGEYKVYDPMDGCYVWKETRQRHWFGPTRAEISLVWLIGSKTTRKGGAE